MDAREDALDQRDDRLDARDALASREAEVAAIDAAIEGVESGTLTVDESGETPRLMPAAPAEGAAPDQAHLMQRLAAFPKGQERATSLVGRLFGALNRRAQADAERVLSRVVDEIGRARDVFQGIVSRLSGEAATSGKTALKSLTRSLVSLRRHDAPESDEKNLPDRG